MAIVVLENSDGQETSVRMEDQMLYDRSINEGDRVYFDEKDKLARVLEGGGNRMMKKLAVIFPGIGYHCDKPLLYYGRMVAKECGYKECINVNYSYDGGNIRGNEEKMQEAFRALYAQAEKLLAQVEFDAYEEILFLSKSVGTVISSEYAKKRGIKCRNVLYTPLKQTYLSAPENGIAFLGTEDPWSNVTEIIALSKENEIPIYTYDGANHSLEIRDIQQNLEILEDVMSTRNGGDAKKIAAAIAAPSA